MIFGFRKITLLLVAVILSLSFSQSYAFIPESVDIIKLAVEKIVEPVGIVVAQKRRIYTAQKDAPTIIEETEAQVNSEIDTGSSIIEESIIDEMAESKLPKEELPFIEFTEKLWFSYPGKFRSEAVTGSHDMICVESRGKYIKIIDEFIASKEKSLTDLYTDILLFRQPELLTRRLKKSGVDLSLSSFQRYDENIYFVLGTPPKEDEPSSSLWVEKDTFFPARYTICKNDLFVDIFYKDWQKVSRTWYPMQIKIYRDGLLFTEITSDKFELEADFEKQFFNIKRLIQIFPESSNLKNESEAGRVESDEIEKSITEFKKLYE